MPEKLVIPQLKMERTFHEALLPDIVNGSPPHMLDNKLIEEAILDLMPRKFSFDSTESSIGINVLKLSLSSFFFFG